MKLLIQNIYKTSSLLQNVIRNTNIAYNRLNSNSNVDTNENFKTIYKFPHIKFVSSLNKLKIYQSLLTGISIPAVGILQKCEIINSDVFWVAGSVGVTGTLTLFLVGQVCSNFIGFIYTDTKHENIKVSYADFWGRRKNIIIPIDDIVPLSESPKSLTDTFYLQVRRYSNNEILKLNLNHGHVIDRNKFEVVLGAN